MASPHPDLLTETSKLNLRYDIFLWSATLREVGYRTYAKTYVLAHLSLSFYGDGERPSVERCVSEQDCDGHFIRMKFYPDKLTSSVVGHLVSLFKSKSETMR